MSASSSFAASRAGLLAVFIATVFVGWKLAGDPAPPAPDAAASPAAGTKASPRNTRRSGRVYGPTDQARAQMRAIRDAGDSRDRMRATISLVNSLPISEIGRWLEERWFENRDGFELTLFNKLAKERWQKEDPDGYLLWTIRNNSGTASDVFSQWAESDPRRLLAFFQETPDSARELQALREIAANDPAMALARFNEMAANGEIGEEHQYLGHQLLLTLAKSSPAALEAALASMPGTQRAQAEAALIGERITNDFAGEIRKLWDRPDGWKLFEASLNGSSRDGIGEKLRAELGNLPDSWKASITSNYYLYVSEKNAADWLATDFAENGFTEEQARRIQSFAIQRMASKDPMAALKSLESLQMPGKSRESSLKGIFTNNARDEAKTAELMALLDTDADRQIAEQAIEQYRSRRSASSQPEIETPAQWIEQAAAMDKNSSGYKMTSMLRNWTPEQIAEIGREFQSMPAEHKLVVADLLSGKRSSYDIDPVLRGDAIVYLIEHPAPTDGDDNRNAAREASSLVSNHVVRWGIKDPAAASQWTDQLPAGEPRLWARKNLAANWADYDPAAARQWVDTLPAAERAEVEKFMKDGPKR